MGNQAYGDWYNFSSFFPFNQKEHFHPYCLITDFTNQNQVLAYKVCNYYGVLSKSVQRFVNRFRTAELVKPEWKSLMHAYKLDYTSTFLCDMNCESVVFVWATLNSSPALLHILNQPTCKPLYYYTQISCLRWEGNVQLSMWLYKLIGSVLCTIFEIIISTC